MAKQNPPSEWKRIGQGIYRDQYGNTVQSATRPTKNMAPKPKPDNIRTSLERNINTPAPPPASQPAQASQPVQASQPAQVGAPIEQPTFVIPPKIPANEVDTEAERRYNRAIGGLLANPESEKFRDQLEKFGTQLNLPSQIVPSTNAPIDSQVNAPAQTTPPTNAAPSSQPPGALATEPPTSVAPQRIPNPKTEAEKRYNRAVAGILEDPNSKKWADALVKWGTAVRDQGGTLPPGAPQLPASQPKSNRAPSEWKRVSPGIYEDQYGNRKVSKEKPTVDMSSQAPGDNNKKDEPKPGAKDTPKPGDTPADSGDTGGGAQVNKYERLIDKLENNPNDPNLVEQVNDQFRKLTPGQQTEQMAQQGGQFYVGSMADYSQYNPNQGFAAYQQSFTDQLNKARDVVMNQFESRMGPEFQRQDMEFQQRMAEQGIDPNSGAYQAQFRAMKQAQNDARQAAATQAFQLGSQYQQQGFEQGKEAYMTPAAIWQTMGRDPYVVQQEALQNAAQRKAQLEAARISGSASVESAKVAGQTQRDIAGMEMMQNYGQQQPNLWAAGLSGLLNTVGPVIANRGQ